MPNHIAIVMDGNGRWAQQRALARTAGHRAGAKSAKLAIELCIKNSINQLTLFAFGKDNWKRPSEETSFLMELFYQQLRAETNDLHRQRIKVTVLGDMAGFPEKLQTQIKETESLTKDNTKLDFVIAANYSGQWEIVEACKEMVKQYSAGKLDMDHINEETFNYILQGDKKVPDLFIRTSGEQRISNFLLWQLAYTELFFTSVTWPDFNEKIFNQAIEAYNHRSRRFGLTTEQIRGDDYP